MDQRNVITIAISDGAHAEEVGREVASRLRFRYVNEAVISMAAHNARIDPEDIDSVEHTRPLADRILQSLRELVSVETTATDAAELFGITPLVRWTNSGPGLSRHREALYRNLIREVLWELGMGGEVVIVAHGASMQLAGMAGVLRVFVTASPETRAARFGQAHGMLPEDAKKHIEHTDHERQAYLRSFYGIHHELPVHYDLVVNTDTLPIPAAAQAIVAAAQAAPVNLLALA